jgi:T5SS/PEP-CTERM-associated repeat protein
MKLSRTMRACCWGACAFCLLASTANATSFTWNATDGLFNDSGNWTQSGFPVDLDNVPDSNDIVTFRSGAHSPPYTVTFPGNGLTPVNYITDQLRVGTNSVTFADGTVFVPPSFQVTVPSTYTLGDTSTTAAGRGIVIGATASDTAAVLTTRVATLSASAATIGDVAGSNGTLNVSAGTFNITGSAAPSLDLFVGNSGTGTLNVTGGADVNVTAAGADAWIGRDPGSTGTANVTGAGSTLSVGHDMYISSGGAGTLNVSAGGQVSDIDGALGYDTGSPGTVNVSGAGSTWTNSGDLTVGWSTSSALKITSGGQVKSATGHIGQGGNGASVVTVDGTNSAWTNSGDLFIGLYGTTNSLGISGGALVSDASGYIATNNSGVSGTVTVNGANSHWSNSAALVVADSGNGTLGVTNGGQVDCANGDVGNVAGSNGVVTVDGANSRWTNTQALQVGVGGSGTLNITGGGAVTSLNGYLAAAVGSIGSATVDGANSTWTNAQSLFVGYGGSGTLNMTNGGIVTSLNGSIGSQNGSSGLVNVDRNNSEFEILAQLVPDGHGSFVYTGGSLQVDGTLQVTNGGVAVAFSVGIGPAGLARVDGANSRWNVVQVLDPKGKPYGGNLAVNGTLDVSNSGTVSIGDLMTIGPQGTVKGDGNIDGIVSNGGLVTPGTSPGALHINGNYTQIAAGKLQIELAGTMLGTNYDQLLVSGGITLDGTLDVSLINAFAPHEGDSFDILDFTSLTGIFSTVNLPALTGSLQWDTSQLYTSGVLSVALPGDYNHNGIVDAADYTLWRDGLGTTYTQADYDVWKSNFGNHSGSGSSANAGVPEPSTLVLLILAAASLCVCRAVTAKESC